jgi:hypothetical protein
MARVDRREVLADGEVQGVRVRNGWLSCVLLVRSRGLTLTTRLAAIPDPQSSFLLPVPRPKGPSIPIARAGAKRWPGVGFIGALHERLFRRVCSSRGNWNWTDSSRKPDSEIEAPK